VCRVDLAMSHDSSGPRRVAPLLERLGVPVRDPARYVLVTDHYVPAESEESEAILQFTRDWSRETGVTLHDEQGICHVVLPEKGHVRPGMLIVGGDSHSCTGGAFGAYMFGIGATEMAGVLATGTIWLNVPETIRIDWDGRFQPAVAAKDVMLYLCGRFGMDGGRYQAVEFGGEAVAAMPMQERMNLCNMTAEFGGQAGRAGRPRPDDSGLPEGGGRAGRSARAGRDVGERPAGAVPGAPSLRRRRARAPGGRAAQPGQRRTGRRLHRAGDRRRLHRRLH